MTELCDLTATELRREIGNGNVSPVELMESCLARIDAVNGAVNAMVAIDRERALADARRAEKVVRDGEANGLLHGLPLAIKDLEDAAGLRTTYGSLLYENHVPEQDHWAVANVRGEGGIVVGKTNTPEFGAGANTRNRVYGATGNPFDPELTCGGSSGGSAVALACSMVPLASGSDYGGSLRTPASFCGVVGFRPSPGVVPSDTRPVSLSPFAVLGSMGRTVADAALLLAAQADGDRRDPLSLRSRPDLGETLAAADLGRLRVALSTDLGAAPVDRGIRKVFGERVEQFRHVFAEADERDPDLGPVHDVFEIIRGVNFVAAHGERVKNYRDRLDANVVDNTERGLALSAADIAWAQVEQSKLYRRVTDLFDEVDILICPAAAVSPFPHQQLYVEEIDGEKMPTYMRWLAVTYALTMATPAVCAIPCGTDDKGLPFGIQVAGPFGSDRFVLEVAHALETYFQDVPALARPVPDLTKLTRAGS